MATLQLAGRSYRPLSLETRRSPLSTVTPSGSQGRRKVCDWSGSTRPKREAHDAGRSGLSVIRQRRVYSSSSPMVDPPSRSSGAPASPARTARRTATSGARAGCSRSRDAMSAKRSSLNISPCGSSAERPAVRRCPDHGADRPGHTVTTLTILTNGLPAVDIADALGLDQLPSAHTPARAASCLRRRSPADHP